MTRDVFGHSSHQNKSRFIRQGPPGVCFKLTSDGQFDLESKRISNVGNSRKPYDAVNLSSQMKMEMKVSSFVNIYKKDVDRMKLVLLKYVPVLRKSIPELRKAVIDKRRERLIIERGEEKSDQEQMLDLDKILDHEKKSDS